MNTSKFLVMATALSVCVVTIAVGDDKGPDKSGKMVWTFKDDVEGKTPAGFREEVGEWKVVSKGGEKVLAQQAKNSNSVFNLVFVSDSRAGDVDLSVRMKAVAGETDQGGGLVWRGKDKNNYYLARFNPLEDNFRLYKVQGGKRSLFLDAEIKATPGWHTLRVTMKGDQIETFFDGEKNHEHKDDTFPDAGMIGLWSKADAQSYFDDLALSGVAFTEKANIENFDAVKAGELPAGWVAGVTGKGSHKWAVVADDTAPSKSNVLKQSGEGTFPWCVKKDSSLVDGFVEVRFKPVSGNADQAGGLIWRFQDGDNYYIARANALEDNVTIYHTIKGKRTEKKRTNMKVASGEWHTLRVEFKANHFTVTFDGQKAIEWDDETFTKTGAVGLWTKADSVTLFDDFKHAGK
jgi:hypothetical protein